MESAPEVFDGLQDAHVRYLEATYHLSHEGLVDERRQLLRAQGTLFAEPWLEAQPKYQAGQEFANLNLDVPGLVDTLEAMAAANLGVYNPPYKHQGDALETFVSHRKDLVVSTGTGSGKTEIFLYSILAHILEEAARGKTNSMRGCRAIVLYPMNALVSDQLSRLRQFYGADVSKGLIREKLGRMMQFAQYTSRTPYHGLYDPDKNNKRVSHIINKLRSLRDADDPSVFRQLLERGRVPAKDLDAFRSQTRWRRFRTAPDDAELFTRQEILSPQTPDPSRPEDYNPHGGTPDLLVTNYSMLEYTLLRPIEQSLWDDTRRWLEADAENQLLIVLDEAHMYRGAQGTEISLLLARFARNLGIPRERIRYILTSASIGQSGADEEAKQFGANLTNGRPESMAVVRGTLQAAEAGAVADDDTTKRFAALAQQNHPDLAGISEALGMDPTSSADDVAAVLRAKDWFRAFEHSISGAPVPRSDVAHQTFGTKPDSLTALDGLLRSLATLAGAASPLIAVRLHLLARGLPSIHGCTNPNCTGKRTGTDAPLGKFFDEPRSHCDDCGSRVFELWSHRDCGAAYLRAFTVKDEYDQGTRFLWSSETQISASDEAPVELEPVVLLVEEPEEFGDDILPDARYLGCETGRLAWNQSDLQGEACIRVWVPFRPNDGGYVRCLACQHSAAPMGTRSGKDKPFGTIQDLQTKGEQPFANLVRTLFETQSTTYSDDPETLEQFPNLGRKVLCFSDSRLKAARLARDLQQAIEQDAFREIFTLAIAEANHALGDEANFRSYLIYLLGVLHEHRIVLLDGKGRVELQEALSTLAKDLESSSLEDLARFDADVFTIPDRVLTMVLRSLQSRHFSLQATMVGMPKIREDVLNQVHNRLADSKNEVSKEALHDILLDLVLRMMEAAAIDQSIPVAARRDVVQGWYSRDPDDFGLEMNRLFPKKIQQGQQPALSSQFWSALLEAIRRGRLVQVSGNQRYFLNPDALWIEITEEDQAWMMCRRCRRPAPTGLGENCPWYQCRGPLVGVATSYGPLAARKNLFRRPALEVAARRSRPYTFRAEEHTAQLNAYQTDDLQGRAERYELWFQDILVPSVQDPDPRPIDVLSCTTTMEVGIDIGSLTGVALRTVPPRPDNYQQRAGRAGRRGTALSTILTYADLSPYEQFVFRTPSAMMKPEPIAPVIHTENTSIIERHVFATLIQAFFFERSPIGQSWRDSLPEDAQLFTSLGTARAFFERPTGHPYGYSAFVNWVESVIDGSLPLADDISAILPRGVSGGALADGPKFIRDCAAALLERLSALAKMANFPPTDDESQDEDFLVFMMRANLRPTFGFPLDSCSFLVKGKLSDKDSNALKTQYEPQQDLQVALSEYAPGKETVIDKETFVSYGLAFPFSATPETPARDIEWDQPTYVAQCAQCDSVAGIGMQAPYSGLCEACGAPEVRSYVWVRPSAFSPAVHVRGFIARGPSRGDDAVAAIGAKLPTPDLQDLHQDHDPIDISSVASIITHTNQRLVVSNLGPEDYGYSICKDCGAIGVDGSAEHDRPFPVESWYPKPFAGWRCGNHDVQTTVALAHEFRTDIALFRIEAGSGFDYSPREPWFRSAAISLAEAMGLAATQVLKLERGELKAGWRPLRRDLASGTSRNIDIFLYDGTPGGAGFVRKAVEARGHVFARARDILTNCTCELACNKCILTYDNKYRHNSLDRHLALQLLNYAETGNLPAYSMDNQVSLVEGLNKLVGYRSPGSRIEVDGDVLKISGEEFDFEFRVRPVLVAENSSVEEITDFQLRNEPLELVEDFVGD